jgi:hypothetical protein
MYHKAKLDIGHLRIFGARAFAHVPLEMQTKLGIKSRECLFMGYLPGQKGYRVCDLATGAFFTSTAVIFDENSPYAPLHDTSPSRFLSTLVNPSLHSGAWDNNLHLSLVRRVGALVPCISQPLGKHR